MAENPGIPSEIILAKLDVTALVVLVPEAEPMVQQFRGKHDSVADGVPAHITILFPFMHPDAVNEVVMGQLRRFLRLNLVSTMYSPTSGVSSVIYLAPEPAQPFITLTESVIPPFLSYPPYEGNTPTSLPFNCSAI